MKRLQKFKVTISILICLMLAMTGCGNPPAQEPDDTPPPAPAPAQEPEKESAPPGFFRWEIVDKRIDKVPLNGKYLLDYQSSYEAPDGWAEEFSFEIFDDYILVNEALIEKEGIVEIDQFEGLTWICFIDTAGTWTSASLNFYLYKPGIFVRETYFFDLFNAISNAYSLTYKREDILLEERQGQEASESEKALLEFDPATFYLDKTFGEVKGMYPDLHYAWYQEGGTFFHSEKADKYFLTSAGWVDEPPDDLEIFGYGANAKIIFPNMGAWIFEDEVRRVADTFSEISDYDKLHFTYQGYSFSCSYGDSYDITPNTLIMVSKLWSEEE